MSDSNMITNNENTNQNNDEENITCYVRCRPLNSRELELNANCIEISKDQKSIKLKNNNERNYTYDKIFSSETDQKTIFNEIGLPLVKKFLAGYNSTIFAYGQTGAGKTHTIIGPLESLFDDKNENFGLIPNILNFLFEKKEEAINIIKESTKEKLEKVDYTLTCSCIEIYNEQLIDLLNNNTQFDKSDEILKIREDPKKGMYIENLTEQEINSAKKAKELLISGFKNRHVASTSMNHESSRSHLIYTLFLSTKLELGDGILKMRSSRLHLVDLAGSERQKYTNTTGQRIKEAGNINKSLSILGNVINAVIEFNEGKTKFVPFRDSKLTYYLKDSIGGNSKTVIIGNISQSFIQINETQSTLNFIQRAKMIKNKSKIIENVNDMVKMLQNEIKNLKIINEELNKKLEDLIKENDEQKKNIEIINKKNKNIKKNKDLEDKIRQELVHEFRKNKNINLKDISQENEIQNLNNNSNFLSKNDLKILFEKINHILSFEDEINENFKFLDMNNVSSIENFLVQKEIYSNEVRNHIDDIINNKEIYIKEINNNNDKLKDKIKIFYLTQDNKKLLYENNVYKSIAEYFVKQTNIEEKKESLSKDIINKFIETNKELSEFYKKHFDINNEYIIIQKSYLEKLKFQIDELKLQDERNNKTIDSIQNENFLLTMELSKYKENMKTTIACSEEKNDKFLELKKSIFLNENNNDNINVEIDNNLDNNNIQKNLNLINDEFNINLQTKESKEFTNRLRASILANNDLDNNINLNNDKNNDNDKENI